MATIYAIAGGPAAGKTTFIAQALEKQLLPRTAFIHDCDAVMLEMPGYQMQLAKDNNLIKAWQTWELPARELAELQLAEQIQARHDIIYDRSCALPSSYTFLKDLVENFGYTLIMYLLYVPIEIAKERAAKRATQIKRHIPLDILIERHVNLSRMWKSYSSLASEAYLIDNTHANPIHVASVFDGNLDISNSTLYNAFLAIGMQNTFLSHS